MSYCRPNYTTKKALKEAVAAGLPVRIFNPGLGTTVENGMTTLEGPHYPQPHRWYAEVKMVGGLVKEVK